MSDKIAVIYADGGSRGNPGPAGSGAILREGTDNGQVVCELSEYVGVTTNNVAEYTGLLIGLRKALELGYEGVDVKMDSELIVKQMNGQYRVKNEKLLPLFSEASQLRRKFTQFKISHVPRAQNKDADRLANQAMDEAKLNNG